MHNIATTNGHTHHLPKHDLAIGGDGSSGLMIDGEILELPQRDSRLGPTFDSSKVTVVFVLGGPGAGKGTQCQEIVKNYDFVHLSAGELLCQERNRPGGSKYGKLINAYIKEGLIVPYQITIGLLEKAMLESGKTRFLIDGFPRTVEQGAEFERTVCASKLVLYYQCPESVMMERILDRAKTSGRVDDNKESIMKRLTTFRNSTIPVFDWYASQGKLCTVQSDKPIGIVHEETFSALKKVFPQILATNKPSGN